VEEGAVLYSQQCAVCHGQNVVGGVKDLRFLTPERHAEFLDIVLGGKLKAQGMIPFADRLTNGQAQAIHAYIIQRAQEDWQPDFTKPRRK
jgi:quinohemoprotein ethanol dehydrogenase